MYSKTIRRFPKTIAVQNDEIERIIFTQTPFVWIAAVPESLSPAFSTSQDLTHCLLMQQQKCSYPENQIQSDPSYTLPVSKRP